VGPASMTRICHANRSLIREVCAGRATNLCLEEDDHAVPNDEARRCWQPPQTKASSSYPSRWGVSTYKRRKQLDSTRWSFLTRGGNVECHMSSAARCSTSPSIATSQRAKLTGTEILECFANRTRLPDRGLAVLAQCIDRGGRTDTATIAIAFGKKA